MSTLTEQRIGSFETKANRQWTEVACPLSRRSWGGMRDKPIKERLRRRLGIAEWYQIDKNYIPHVRIIIVFISLCNRHIRGLGKSGKRKGVRRREMDRLINQF